MKLPKFNGSSWIVGVSCAPQPTVHAWGRFALEDDAHAFAAETQKLHPTWTVNVYIILAKREQRRTS